MRCSRPVRGAATELMTTVWPTVIEAPQLEQKALPMVFGFEHWGHGNVAGDFGAGADFTS
jgi:hypothetical protein